MMLTDLIDAEVALLYQGSDPDERKEWNIIQLNRFNALIEKMQAANLQGVVVFQYVANRMAQIVVDEMIAKAANNG